MAFVIFCITMLFIYWRPLNLPLWVFSTLGALAAFFTNVINSENIARVWEMVSDSTFTLVGLILLTLALEKIGFFAFLATHIVSFLQKTTHTKNQNNIQNTDISTLKLYVFLILFSAFLSALFANDGAILILTPLILTLFSATKNQNNTSFLTPLVVSLLIVSFMSDFASNTFVISNLTNIITAHFFNIDSAQFSLIMLLPQAFIIIGALLFWNIVKMFLPQKLTFATIESNISRTSIIFCFCVLFVLLFGIFYARTLHLPLCVFTLSCAFAAVVYGKILGKLSFFTSLKSAPFGIVIFSLGLFIVVFGLKNSGILNLLNNALPYFAALSQQGQILVLGIASSIGSSVMNNLPMVLLGNLTLNDFGAFLDAKESLIFAHLLGCNVGAKLTPIGSLATLLWLENLKNHNINISFLRYMLIAFCISLPLLLMGLMGLMVGSFIF